MRTVEKGEIAQLKVELRALEKGFIPSRPLIPSRYDLLIDDGNRVWKTQVKYADGKTKRDETVRVALNYTDREKIEHCYEDGQVDSLAIYVPKIERVVWLTADKFCGKMKLDIRISGKPYITSLVAKDYLW